MKTLPSDPEPHKQRHRSFSFSTTEFVCPECGSKKWGTTRFFGKPEKGRCNGKNGACAFTWLRTFDWTVFKSIATGEGFVSFEAFEIACRR